MEAGPSKRMKTMMKETTKSLAELEAFPLEVLVKIFNFLPNHDVRCGVTLACKRFKEICQDESLVPVKDLCIYGHPFGPKSKKKGHEGKQPYWLCQSAEQRQYGGDEAIFDIIRQSKNLTFLKIKALDPETVNNLVSIALQACPKLTNLEIIETSKQKGEYVKYTELGTIRSFFDQITIFTKSLILIFSKRYDRIADHFFEI